ncbi:helix-turn-helix domain-containing protein [Amorphus sp. 3PC139-8]|uniref:helix-turn-helix domain-containing protein n=1 Tax=Amorphus sp. 3PC139-8 TaxID=2735676 RepID=UPI00345D33C0
MKSRGFVPLTRAIGFGSLPTVVDVRAGERALMRAFAEVGLPFELTRNVETPIPSGAMVELFDRCAHILGDRTFGLDIGLGMERRAYGLWGQYGLLAPTLGNAIERYIATSWAQQVGASLELVWRGDHWLWRSVLPGVSDDNRAHTDHLIHPMLGAVRTYLGPDWMPEWIEVNYARDPDAGKLEDRLGVPIRYGRPWLGLVLNPADLTRGRHPAYDDEMTDIVLRDVLADVVMPEASEPARSLSAVVGLRLLEGKTDIEGAARLAHLSVQGLQRQLRKKGYTYRELVDRARMTRAITLLRDSDVSIIEVALSLGYEDHASFTRAFNRWVGCAPIAFRKAKQAGPFLRHVPSSAADPDVLFANGSP